MNRPFKAYLKYEAKVFIKSWYTIFFGAILGNMLALFIGMGMRRSVPAEILPRVLNSMAMSLLCLIPLVNGMISYAALTSMEFEKRIPLRLRLFGLSEGKRLVARIVVYTSVTYLFMAIYLLFNGLVLKNLLRPAAVGLLTVFVHYTLLLWLLIVLSHGISLFFSRFSPSYATVMMLYFAFMIFGGMMGVDIKDMPSWAQNIGHFLPFSYYPDAMGPVWTGNGTLPAGYYQALLTLIFFSGIILFIAFWKRTRRIS